MSREELPFEVIQTWKPEQLKEFCRKRDLKVSGPKAERVARVFAAAEMGIAVKPTAQERIAATEKEIINLYYYYFYVNREGTGVCFFLSFLSVRHCV